MSRAPLSFLEFFAGGGMARLGLGARWDCAFANDFDPVKAATYRANFADAGDHFHEGDVWKLGAGDLPGRADLAWASSPCQDFSLAGARAGLAGGRSGAFFGFWRLIEGLAAEGRAPRAIVIENVEGHQPRQDRADDDRDHQQLQKAIDDEQKEGTHRRVLTGFADLARLRHSGFGDLRRRGGLTEPGPKGLFRAFLGLPWGP